MTDCASSSFMTSDPHAHFDTFSSWSEQDLEPVPIDYSSQFSTSAMMAKKVSTATTLPYDDSAIAAMGSTKVQPSRSTVALFPVKHNIMEASKTTPPDGVLLATFPQGLGTNSFWSAQDLEPSPIGYSSLPSRVVAKMPLVSPPYNSPISTVMGFIKVQPSSIAFPVEHNIMETSNTPPPGMLFTCLTASQLGFGSAYLMVNPLKGVAAAVPYQAPHHHPKPTFEVGRTELPDFSIETRMDWFAKQADGSTTNNNVARSHQQQHTSAHTNPSIMSFQAPSPSTFIEREPCYPNVTFEVGRTELPKFSSEGTDCFAKQVDVHQQADGSTTNGVDRSQQQQQQQQQHRSEHPSIMGFQAPPSTIIENTKTSSCELNSARKKAKDFDASAGAPFRPLSPYNYFFRDERERLLMQQDFLDSGVVFSNHLSPAKEQRLLFMHWNRDRTAKRSHRKSHGKISFRALTQSISAAWKRLGARDKAFYQAVSTKDWTRYRSELKAFQKKTLVGQTICADDAKHGV